MSQNQGLLQARYFYLIKHVDSLWVPFMTNQLFIWVFNQLKVLTEICSHPALNLPFGWRLFPGFIMSLWVRHILQRANYAAHQSCSRHQHEICALTSICAPVDMRRGGFESDLDVSRCHLFGQLRLPPLLLIPKDVEWDTLASWWSAESLDFKTRCANAHDKQTTNYNSPKATVAVHARSLT